MHALCAFCRLALQGLGQGLPAFPQLEQDRLQPADILRGQGLANLPDCRHGHGRLSGGWRRNGFPLLARLFHGGFRRGIGLRRSCHAVMGKHAQGIEARYRRSLP